MLLGIGVLALLGGTFVVGAVAGRLSLRPSASLTASARSQGRDPKPTPAPQPELTFYRELTAPLTPAPLPPKPAARPPAKRDSPAQPPARVAAAPAETARVREPDATPAPTGSPGPGGARYTVQVGAYNLREQAETLRTRLLAAGHEAYVTEGVTPAGTRYRVRIGTYATADDARQAAARIGTQAQVPTYVTTR